MGLVGRLAVVMTWSRIFATNLSCIFYFVLASITDSVHLEKEVWLGVLTSLC